LQITEIRAFNSAKAKKKNNCGGQDAHPPELQKKRLSGHKLAVANGLQIYYNEGGHRYYYH